ncbi:hypothetical protein HMPREF1982_00194 [Clostridiales bacterium oral taxon 876 str. F0540]|nr:hypothetical protein HMPREF1982_00194 [Clostridiales bacterium oral taxon 876 str. F0540]
MLNIQFGVTKENLELLNNIVNEAADYGIWSVFYGEQEIAAVESIKTKIGALREEGLEKEKGNSLLQLNFIEGQTLKKIIVFYLTNNFKNLRRREFETISDFILFVDDSLAFEIEEKEI